MNSFVKPYPPRYNVKNLESSIEITVAINMAKNGFMVALSIFFSIFWLAFGIFSLWIIIQDATSIFPFTLPKIIYILPIESLVGGILIALAMIWRFTFKEIIIFSDTDIVVNHQSRIFNRSNRYLAEYISDLRAATSYFNKPIVFDYGARTMRFGQGLDEAEAKQIIAIIKERFPVYLETKK